MSQPSNVVSVLNPQIAPNQSIYEASDTQKARLGTRIDVGARVYHYAVLSTSANVEAGNLLCAPQIVASNQSGIASCGTAATGVSTISISVGTAVTANQYAEGYLVLASSGLAGGGTIYKIKSHPVVATNASGVFTLYDPFPATVAAAPVNLVPSLFNGVKVGSEALDVAVGVAPCAVTTGQYFWLQTWGPASPKHVTTTPAAAALRLGTLGGVQSFSVTGTLGATASALIDYSCIIGKNFNLAATATQCNPVFLTIIP